MLPRQAFTALLPEFIVRLLEFTAPLPEFTRQMSARTVLLRESMAPRQVCMGLQPCMLPRAALSMRLAMAERLPATPMAK